MELLPLEPPEVFVKLDRIEMTEGEVGLLKSGDFLVDPALLRTDSPEDILLLSDRMPLMDGVDLRTRLL